MKRYDSLEEEMLMAIGEYIERLCFERRLCQELGYDMELIDDFIVRKMAQEKERFEGMTMADVEALMMGEALELKNYVEDIIEHGGDEET